MSTRTPPPDLQDPTHRDLPVSDPARFALDLILFAGHLLYEAQALRTLDLQGLRAAVRLPRTSAPPHPTDR